MNNKELYELKRDLRLEFMANVRDEYRNKHMSKNLVKSMTKRTTKKQGNVTASVYIMAPEYDIWEWWYNRVIVKLNTGSYAEDNDSGSGGLKPIPKGKRVRSDWRRVKASNPYGSLRLQATHNHNEFVERNMVAAIPKIMKKFGIKNYEIILKGR